MEIRELPLRGVFEAVPHRVEDGRGFFAETYNERAFAAAGIGTAFVQDNQTLSRARGTVRGLHYQLAPHAQAKLVRVVRGAVFDVAVDIRRSSPSFGRWTGLELSARTGNQILVPPGFAHGFVTLEDDTEVIYKVSAYYSPAHDRAIRFDDPDIQIAWPPGSAPAILSERDRYAPRLAEAEVFP